MLEASLILAAVLLLLLASSAPIAVALGLASLIYFYYFTLIPMTQVSERLFNALNSFPLMAIPFFILAANIMSQGGISRRMTDFSASLVGHLRGGMAISTVIACIFFAAVSGSSPATVVAVGALMIPAMIRNGYPKEFSTGLVATSGSLGILIPPSIALIVFGIATEQNIGDLFLAGILPGLLAGIMLLGMVVLVAWKKGYGHAGQAFRLSNSDRWRAFRDAILALALPFLVLGGIYSGWFTPTEAAAVAVAYSLVVSLVIYREIKVSQLWSITLMTVKTSSMVMFIIANGILFTFVLASERIPGQISTAITEWQLQPWQFLILVNILLLFVGCVMETSSAILILAPILLPIAVEMGIDPIHFGIIVVMNLEIGMITPPLGLNLFVASGMSGMSVTGVAKAAIPSALVLLAALAIVTFVPFLSTALI
ncbi:TRAP transporter large permease [Brevibacterium luteolum]|uniref:TRAP transporter large permease n=1 Tax=Brevibacterium luteolum TaxID=199591 RepID=UPI003EEB2B4F